jgi:hypothetical protein
VAASTFAAGPPSAGADDGAAPVTCEGEVDDAKVTVEALPPPADQPPVTVAPLPPEATAGYEVVRALDIRITLDDAGNARITETIDYGFGTQRRHGIFRDLTLSQPCTDDWDRVWPLDDLTVTSLTAPHDVEVEGTETGDTRLRIGDPETTVTGDHTYVVDYTLGHVTNSFDDHDELYWNVVGTGWDVPIANTTVTVDGPVGALRTACFAGSTGTSAPCDAHGIDPTTDAAVFGQTLLNPYEGLTVAIAYPPQSFSGAPIIEQRWTVARAFSVTPLTVGGAGVLLATAIGLVTWLAWSVGRDRQAVGSHVDAAFAASTMPGAVAAPDEPVPLTGQAGVPVEFVPPGGIRPAQLGLLVDEKVVSTEVSATIVDLAVRGWLRIEQEGEGRKADYRLVRLRHDDAGLLPYEALLVTALFSSGDTVELSDLKDTFAAKQTSVVNAIYDGGVAEGWFARRPDRVRAGWVALGFLGVLIGGGVTALLAWQTELALLGVPLVLAALLVMALAGRFPRRTAAGTGMTRRARGFEHFIRDSEAPRARWAEQRNIFSIVLGCTDRWADTFAPLGAAAVAGASAWYVGTHPLDVHGLGRATSSFASSATSTMSSTPSSSGSSGFSGGSVGGGGGGGGGGSW